MLPEAQLYHYKARVYDPSLGRFLQTDPVGYEDDVNLYAYVYNDPLDRTDPSGLSCMQVSSADSRLPAKYDCKVDSFSTKGMTEAQAKEFRQQVRTFERAYTTAMNKMAMNPTQSATVQGAGINKFNVKAYMVIDRLKDAKVIAAPGVKSPAAKSPSASTIEVYDAVLGRDGKRSGEALFNYQQMAIVHEGIHRTGWGPTAFMRRSLEGEWATHGASLGYPSNFDDDHWQGYNRAARELLGQ